MTKTVSELWAASRAVAKHLFTQDEPGNVQDVYDIGGVYRVHVHRLDTEDAMTQLSPKVSYESIDRYSRRKATNVGAVFENIEVSDGRLTIHVDDVVQMLVDRVEPEELASALWANAEVRQKFVDALVRRYNADHVDDSERRAVLAGCQSVVHDQQLDEAVRKLQSMEHTFCRSADYHGELYIINKVLREKGITETRVVYDLPIGSPPLTEEVPLQFREDPDIRIGGQSWEDARTHWRAEMLAKFPPPPKVDGVTLDAPPDIEDDLPV